MLFPRLEATRGDRAPALIHDGQRLGWRDLAAAVRAHHASLGRAGIGAGDRVAVWTHAALETTVALVGNATAGVVSVPLNPQLGDRELGHVLSDARPRAVYAAPSAPIAERTPQVPFHHALLDLTDPGPIPALADDDAPLLVLYTSGTTGAPKGAVLTRRNVATNLDALAQAWTWTARDRIVHALPLFHVHGLVLGLFGALRMGGALEWHGRFDPGALASSLASSMSAEEATVLFAVPTLVHRLAEAAERDPSVAEGLRRARLLVSGSAALPVREHQRIRALTGRCIVERYGLTETLINCSLRAGEPPAPGRVGRPLDGIELVLVDEARRAIDTSDDQTMGEVAVRGPSVFAGYLNRDDATAAVRDAAGWFYTGDLATRDASGSLRLVGRRATDLIKTGGFKVGAGEVEAALLEHEGVRECAVVGVADDDLGERIVAWVVARDPAAPPSEDALSRHVAALLAPHKRPRGVEFVDELPRNPMGKVLKSELRTRR